MSLYMRRPHTPDPWLPVTSSFTKLVNNAHLGLKKDLIVFCFDTSVETWETEPAAWYTPLSSELVINIAKVFQGKQIQKHITEKITKKPWSKSRFDLITTSKGQEFYIPNEGELFELASHVNYRVNEIYFAHTPTFSRPILDDLYYFNKFFEKYTLTSKNYFDEFISTMLGVVLHETGHSVVSNYITEKWYRELSSYEMQIITLFEELRCEYQQIQRVGALCADSIRFAAAVVVDVDQMVDDLKLATSSEDSDDVAASSIALNSTLILGRSLYNVFDEKEVSEVAISTEMVVGQDRYESMIEIWTDYMHLDTMTEGAAKGVLQRWLELFPSSSFKSSVAPVVIIDTDGEVTTPDKDDSENADGSGDSKSGDDAGESDGQGEGEKGDQQAEEPTEVILDSSDIGSEKFTEGPKDDETSSSSSSVKRAIDGYDVAVKIVKSEIDKPFQRNTKHKLTDPSEGFKKLSKRTIRKVTPNREDYTTAREMVHALQRIYTTGRDRFHVHAQLPPGRLDSRAAVQNAANRKNGMQSRKNQWVKTKTTVGVNPKLTVGIMTDCSGSQYWAEEFSSRMSWILSKAFRTVSARTASVAFGHHTYMVSVPDEPLNERPLVRAEESDEKFDRGIAALDHVLKLSTANGVKLLFVLTDGIFVIENENEKACQWADLLKEQNCEMIWICPKGQSYTCPPAATVMEVSEFEVKKDPKSAINAVIKIIEDRLSDKKIGAVR